MKEIPILFSTPMVKAILQGRKTMTRRTRGLDKINTDPSAWSAIYYPNEEGSFTFYSDRYTKECDIFCPYGKVGDLLYVRETWCKGITKPYHYAASVCSPKYDKPDGGWKPSIHMPKEAARIWLQVDSVRIERLADITKVDALAEGIDKYFNSLFQEERYTDYLNLKSEWRDPVSSFHSLWSKINGAESWNSNPWVWVVTFKVISTTGKPNA